MRESLAYLYRHTSVTLPPVVNRYFDIPMSTRNIIQKIKNPLMLYGENAFTFRFFNSIHSNKPALRKFLDNLKRFDNPKCRFLTSRNPDLEKEPEIWLFPSFGKRWGFGEPDALLLVDDFVLWFEVETTFDLDDTDKSNAIDSLRQLYRFHRAAVAFAEPPTPDTGRLFIQGATITDGDEPRPARLALRGHGVLAKLRRRLRTACNAANSHYVLLSEKKPGGGERGFRKQLVTSAQRKFRFWDAKIGESRPLQVDHCWYTYWRGDLNRFFKKEDFLAGYVPIKKGS